MRLRSAVVACWCALSLASGVVVAVPAVASELPGAMPPTLRGLVPLATLAQAKPALSSVAKADAADVREVRARVAKAYGTSAVGVQRYSDPGLLGDVLVIAVQRPTPGLFTTAPSAQRLGLAIPQVEVVVQGAVQCLVYNDSVTPGSPVPANAHHLDRCQRSDARRTVIVEFNGTDDNTLTHDIPGAYALVNAAWSATA